MDSRTGVKRTKKLAGRLAPAEFDAAVNEGENFPCVLLMGEEDYLIQRAEQAYLDKLLSGEFRDFDFVHLTGDVAAPDLRESLCRLPLVAPYCVLYLDGPAELRQDSAEILKDYLRKPSASLKVVLTEFPTQRRLKDKLKEEPLHGLADLATTVQYLPLKEAQLAEWIVHYVSKQGKKITNEAAQYLMEISTNSLRDLAAKLDHAVHFIGTAKEIDILVVQRISGITSEVTLFQLEEALFHQSLSDCLRISKRLFEGGSQILQLTNYLHRSLTRVWQIKTTLHSRDRDVLHRKILGAQHWKRREFEQAARTVSMEAIERGLVGLLDLEIALKTRVVEEDILFYHWLYETLAGASEKAGTQGRNRE
jgi:DNA polymerase-3 subunit delta